LNDRETMMGDADIERAVLAYLAGHPHAADSAEGVARWWLRGAAATLPEVESALRQLVARQALRQERLADGTALYSRSRRRAPSP